MLGNEILKKENALTGAKKGQENHCSPSKKRIGNTITLEKPNGYKFKTSRYRIVVTGLVSESQ